MSDSESEVIGGEVVPGQSPASSPYGASPGDGGGDYPTPSPSSGSSVATAPVSEAGSDVAFGVGSEVGSDGEILPTYFVDLSGSPVGSPPPGSYPVFVEAGKSYIRTRTGRVRVYNAEHAALCARREHARDLYAENPENDPVAEDGVGF